MPNQLSAMSSNTVTQGLFAPSTRVPFTRIVTSADRSEMKKVFYDCDAGNKGYLNDEDLKVAVISLFGYKPSKTEVEKIFEKWGDISVSRDCLYVEQFVEAMVQKTCSMHEDEHIRQIFLAFDTQCRGFLSIEDLKKTFQIVAPSITLPRLESTFREADRDGDGRVSYKDFEFMMKYRCEDDPL